MTMAQLFSLVETERVRDASSPDVPGSGAAAANGSILDLAMFATLPRSG